MAKWGRGKNRAFGHVHNWRLSISNWGPLVKNPDNDFYGMYADRYWECIRGGKVKHRMPLSPFQSRVFLAMSGSPYHVEEPY